MADREQPEDGPSLEMPSLSLRRRRRTEAAAEPPADPGPTVVPSPPSADEADDPAPAPRRAPRSYDVRIPGLVAALATGLVVGLAAALLGWLLGAGCDAVRGTSSCGGAIGLPALLASLVLLAWLGGLLLRVLGVADAGSTSILAVAVGAVVVLVVLLGSLDQWWVVLALPVTVAVAYAAAWWVTAVLAATHADTDVDAGQPRDVR
ncbi:hypothetical protein [Nocardioides zeicaulis]|uniref:Uncharacterized protein n=1 Tax=Nocardioides zeicaulis TaxID=1776857 RepID=A0ABV6E292_9ACTN